MKVYLDTDFIAHAEPGEGYIEAESSFFNVIAPELFPCYRFIPEGFSWEREDGTVFEGEMLALEFPAADMVSRQQAFEAELVAEMTDMRDALNELEVTVDG